jgi:hypothetical protein
MLRQGRPVDSKFDVTEKLYRRCVDREVREGRPFVDQIPFYPAMSVNRSKFSKPHDVLYPDYFDTCGVLSFTVGDIPEPYQIEGGARYEWKPEHDPLEENYSHTEVRTYRDGAFDRNHQIGSKLVKKYFRECLRRRARIEIVPGEGRPEGNEDDG